MLSHFSHVQLFVTPWTVASVKLLCPSDSLGKNIGVGCHALLQGIFLTQGSNTCLMFPALADRFFPLVPTHYSDIKMNEIMPFAATLMGLEYIMLSQTEKDTS